MVRRADGSIRPPDYRRIDDRSAAGAINAVQAPDDPEVADLAVRVMHTNIPWDLKNKTLVYNQLWGQGRHRVLGQFRHAEVGHGRREARAATVLGEVGFLQTVSNWPIAPT